ncbi:MAG TPA: hypothetical protein VHL58_04045 [Thermoanaerobaculia bacterium]|nr:hypothetical protein [Thermoanaerobaculia bacterium]
MKERGFQITDFRGYGGNILAVLYPEVRWERAPESLLPKLVEADAETAARNGSYCAVIIARPRRGAGRVVALARYALAAGWFRFRLRIFLKPKLLRVRLGLLRRMGFEAKW